VFGPLLVVIEPAGEDLSSEENDKQTCQDQKAIVSQEDLANANGSTGTVGASGDCGYFDAVRTPPFLAGDPPRRVPYPPPRAARVRFSGFWLVSFCPECPLVFFCMPVNRFRAAAALGPAVFSRLEKLPSSSVYGARQQSERGKYSAESAPCQSSRLRHRCPSGFPFTNSEGGVTLIRPVPWRGRAHHRGARLCAVCQGPPSREHRIGDRDPPSENIVKDRGGSNSSLLKRRG
jgi:hypothetical protein